MSHFRHSALKCRISHDLALIFKQLPMTFWYVKHHKYFCEYAVQNIHLYPQLNH